MLTADDVQKWLEERRAGPNGAQGAASEPRDRARGVAASAGSEGPSPGGRGATLLVLRDPVRVPRPEGVLAAMEAAQPEPARQWPWALSLAVGLLSGLVLGVGAVGLMGSAPPWLLSALGTEEVPARGDDLGATAAARPPAAEPSPAELAPAEPVLAEPAAAEPAMPRAPVPVEPVLLEPRPAEPEPPAAATPEAGPELATSQPAPAGLTPVEPGGPAPAAPEPPSPGPAASDAAPPAPRLVDPPRGDPRAVLVQADRRPVRRRSAPLDAPEPEDGPAVLTASAPIAAEAWRPTALLAPEPSPPVPLEVSALPAVVRLEPVPALPAPPSADRLPPPEVGDAAVATVAAPAGPRPQVALHLSPGLPQTAIYAAQAAVTEAGLDLAGTSIARFGVAESEVRFFHDEDAAEAARISDGLDARPRDFSAYRPAPPPGTLEVWLAQDG